MEKHFDEITKDDDDDKKQINKLIKAFEKNLEKKAYDFDYIEIKEDILLNHSLLSMDINTIKVYQLCKILE